MEIDCAGHRKGKWQPHGGHPDIYYAMMQDMAIGKEQALAMRKDILQWNCGERHEVLGG